MNSPLAWSKMNLQRGVGIQGLEYGPNGDGGYAWVWESSDVTKLGHILVAIIPRSQMPDAADDDAGSVVTNHSRARTLLHWLATFTAPAVATPIIATIQTDQARSLPQPGLGQAGTQGWCWHQCVLETPVPTYHAMMQVIVLMAMPYTESARRTHDAAFMVRQARGVAKVALMIEAEQQ